MSTLFPIKEMRGLDRKSIEDLAGKLAESMVHGAFRACETPEDHNNATTLLIALSGELGVSIQTHDIFNKAHIQDGKSLEVCMEIADTVVADTAIHMGRAIRSNLTRIKKGDVRKDSITLKGKT